MSVSRISQALARTRLRRAPRVIPMCPREQQVLDELRRRRIAARADER